jgi:predicted nuclease with TOPRIM domain
MSNETEDDITELELKDDALESRMKKLEREASRLLNHSNELLQELIKARSKPEETEQEDRN